MPHITNASFFHRLVEKKKQRRNRPNKSTVGKGIFLVGLFMLITLPLVLVAVSRKGPVTEIRSRAELGVTCTGTCKGEESREYPVGFICVNNNSTKCLTCQGSGTFAQSPVASCTTGASGATRVGGIGSCDDAAKWPYEYRECCSEGRSRQVKRVCENGKFYWDVGPCDQTNGLCTQSKQTGIVCPANTAFFEGKCYEIGKCSPSCIGKACGVSDGCGGVCTGSCASQEDATAAIAETFTRGMKFAYSSLNYKKGYYTNLCGNTLTATNSCNLGCNPATGTCTSPTDKQAVVKFTCNGKSIECRDGESSWATSQNVGTPSCGKTIQIDVFKKNCRSGGAATWSCGITDLLDYMVFYSGDCNPPTPTPTKKPSPTPTYTPTPTKTPTPTRAPTRIPTRVATAAPTVPTGVGGPSGSAGALASCNQACTNTLDCLYPYVCETGRCRSFNCVADASCTCSQVATPSAVPTSGSGGFGDLFGPPGSPIGCNERCTYPIDCPGGFTCQAGACRKASCPDSGDCLCTSGEISPTTTPTPTPTPAPVRRAGGSVWSLFAIIGLLVLVVFLAIKFLLPKH